MHDDLDDIGDLGGGNNAGIGNNADVDHDDGAVHGRLEKKRGSARS